MVKHTVIINGERQRENALAILQNLPLEPVHEIIFRPHKKDRSASQNRLYWQWLTVIAGETGHTKDEMHEFYKGLFLTRIFTRDDNGYAEMAAAIKALRGRPEYEAIAAQVKRLTSTTDASVEQFTEYLTDIEQHALKQGIALPHPEDLYMEAMG